MYILNIIISLFTEKFSTWLFLDLLVALKKAWWLGTLQRCFRPRSALHGTFFLPLKTTFPKGPFPQKKYLPYISNPWMFLAETKEMEYISNFLWKENKFASLKYQVNAWFAMINKRKKNCVVSVTADLAMITTVTMFVMLVRKRGIRRVG